MKTATFASALSAALLLAATSPVDAATISFHVQANTAPLIANVNGPFFLDFVLTDGSGTLAGVNTVTVDHFTFGGGGAVGGATLISGASGSLASSVGLSDGGAFLNEFLQQFTPGSTLGFDVSLTTNADPGFPDAFSFGILDKNQLNLPTTGPGDALLLANISASLRVSQIQTFATTTPAGVTVTAVPEPATLLLLTGGIAASVARRRRGLQKRVE